ncbi:MAG: S9 family peptidase [Clostridia bacterium]|jgi:cysteine synthase|nr:S9 family peptidase [Clostridia bacterium]
MDKIQIDKYLTSKESDVFLILTGLGGSTSGYSNKYETIAINTNKKFGLNVFVANTPHGSYENHIQHLNYIFNSIDREMQKQDYNVFVMGHSAGGTIMLWNLNLFPKVKRIIAVNPVLNINFHKIENSSKNFTGEFIKIIMGEKDGSCKFLPLLNKVINIETLVLKDIDHEFKGNLEKFIELPVKYLFI